MNIIINEDFTEELLERFSAEVNEAYKNNVDYVNIYLDSYGGSDFACSAMIHITNQLALDIPVEIVAHGNAMSAGFSYLFGCRCEKTIMQGVVGMAHKGSMKKHIYDGATQDKLEDFKDKVSLVRQKENEKLLKRLKFTKKEKTKFRKGKDVYFLTKRMRELLREDSNNHSTYSKHEG